MAMFTSISNSGAGAHLNLNIGERDCAALIKALVDAGIARYEDNELAEIVATEEADSKAEPFGAKEKAWSTTHTGKDAHGNWQVGLGVANQVLPDSGTKY